ncbi:TPA: hypothetical protein KRD75_003133 [Clostridioides difficile]|uniref:DUF3139 domain-containing protein n=2 Tax=Clostridioides difficile TaxID=1496 RepID=A0A2R4NC44_CLODI|nr:hypothetical protein plasmid_LIBA6289_00010 [Clostridioides difficile]HBG7322944.1 hypothetical protein [Clostridioides difficile]
MKKNKISFRKWFKFYLIGCSCICIIVSLFMLMYFGSNRIETMETHSAYNFIESKIPTNAKYQGYKKNHINAKTVLYYSYKDSIHTVELYHPENNLNEVDWNEVTDIKFD